MSDSDNSQNSEESTESDCSLSTGDVTMDPTEQPNIHSQEGLVEENFDPVMLLQQMEFRSGYRLFQTLIDIITITVSFSLLVWYLRDPKFPDKRNSHPVMQEEEEIDERTSRFLPSVEVFATVVLLGVILAYRLGESIYQDWRNFHPAMALEELILWIRRVLLLALNTLSTIAALFAFFIRILTDPKFLDKRNSHPVMQEEEIDERSLFAYAIVVLLGVLLAYRFRESIYRDWRRTIFLSKERYKEGKFVIE